ncbi:MAG: acyl-CoA reductase [Spongiibacteraceae bacterium]
MKVFKVPLIIRGEVIDDFTVEYPGRKGGVSFVTPDVNKYLKKLTTTPASLEDLYRISIDDILDFMVEVGARFNLESNPYVQEAFEISTLTSGMTEPVLRAVYSGFDKICEKSFLSEYVEAQVGRKYLESWVPVILADGRTFSMRAYGSRMVHAIAGNSPMCAFLTVLRNAVTRSDAIIKLPSNDPLTAVSLLRTMIDIDADHPITHHASAAYWKGGDENIEARIYTPRNIEKIVAWGGFASIKHITKYLQPGIDLITLDPKHSASIIGKEGLASDATIQEIAWRAASDCGAFNQELCSNSRVIYVHCDAEDSDEMARLNQFGKALYDSLQKLPSTLSTPAKYRIPELEQQINALVMDDDYYRVFQGAERCGAVIVSQTDEPVEFTAMLACRTVNIVPIADLADIVKRINSDTQTIGIYPASLKESLRQQLGFQGAQHLIDLGYMVYLDFVGPQDAVEVERRMLKWVKDITIKTEIAAKPWEGKKSHDALLSGQLF